MMNISPPCLKVKNCTIIINLKKRAQNKDPQSSNDESTKDENRINYTYDTGAIEKALAYLEPQEKKLM